MGAVGMRGAHVAMILVVDDEQGLRASLTRMLQRDGMEVVEASDGQTALEALEAVRPAVVLLDIEMPGLSGLEVLDRIHQTPRLSAIPVIMLTGRSTRSDIVEGLSRGAYDYLTKPFQ